MHIWPCFLSSIPFAYDSFVVSENATRIFKGLLVKWSPSRLQIKAASEAAQHNVVLWIIPEVFSAICGLHSCLLDDNKVKQMPL